MLTGLLLSGVFFYSRVTADLPSHREILTLLDPQEGELLQPTRIYDRSGTVVLWSFQNPTLEERIYAELDLQGDQLESEIPPEVVKAALAAGDIDFFTSPSWNLRGWFQPRTTSLAERLAADLLFWGEGDHPYYPIRLRILSSQLMEEYGREQILEWYLNSQSYGNQIYGIGAAARLYFNKPVSELNLAEAALLAGVGETPTLNPWNSPAAARENQLQLLEAMEEEGLITSGERRSAARADLRYSRAENGAERLQPAYVNLILDQASRVIPRSRLLRGGLEIRSSLDADLQQQLECTAAYEIARAGGQPVDLPPKCAAARLLPVQPAVILSGENKLALQAVMLDPKKGEILAALGSSGSTSQADLLTAHNPGTVLTPFIYLTAFTQGLEPASLVWDVPPAPELYSVEELHPACPNDCQFSGPVSIRTALINDYLSPAIEIWNAQNPSRVESLIRQVGIELDSELCQECERFPGSHGISILEIAHGFSVFSNLGDLYGLEEKRGDLGLEPVVVLEIKDLSGEVWMQHPGPTSRSVLSEELAYLINHTLSDENSRIYRWQRNLFEIGRPAAVKNGLVEDGHSAWTVGYTPQIITAVRAETPEDSEEISDLEISRMTSGLWRALTQYASQDLPIVGWDPTPEILFLDVCYPSGKLPTANCPEVVREVFIDGNQPVERDDLYQVLEVNRETGRLATVFTPAELIEGRTYLQIPEQAEEWAVQQGIAVPPESYDPALETSTHEELEIKTPQNYSAVAGKISLEGRIKLEEFVSYRLQIGRGLNPTTWQQIVEERTTAPSLNRLGTWDTTQVEDGLYALQLIVLRESQRVEKAAVLVSVDNTPPVITLNRPEEKDEFLFSPGEELNFSAEAADNLEMDRVEFYLNDRLVAARKEVPYLFVWKMGVGDFTLEAVAYDRAGNQVSAEADFTVKR